MKAGSIHVQTKIIGKHNINNIIAAIEIADILKVPHINMMSSLYQFELKNNRCEFVKTKNNEILLDAYNANPTSMSSGILNFLDWRHHNPVLEGGLEGHQPTLFILGDMLELGEHELQYHEEIINLLKEKRVENCILVGNVFNKTTVCENDFTYYAKVKSTLDAAELLKKRNFTDMTIFIKGSRKLSLEKLVDYL
jgi:UDP-N-acetylmuramoyl-tripeptide--D-alanyl-D-alanine ligase